MTLAIIIIFILIKIVRTQFIHKSITGFIQHTYFKIITEEAVAFVSKLFVVAPCCKIIAIIYFIRKKQK